MQLPTILTTIVASLAFAAGVKPSTSASALTSSIPAVLFMPSAALLLICVRGDTCFELCAIDAKWGGDDNEGPAEDDGDAGASTNTTLLIASVNTTKIASGAEPVVSNPSAKTQSVTLKEDALPDELSRNTRRVCFYDGRYYDVGISARRRLKGDEDGVAGTAIKCVPRGYGLRCEHV